MAYKLFTEEEEQKFEEMLNEMKKLEGAQLSKEEEAELKKMLEEEEPKLRKMLEEIEEARGSND